MAYKLILESIEGLDDAVKALYVKNEATGKYHLDVDPADIPDVEGLKRKNTELLEEKKEQQRLARENADKAARAAGDIEALDRSWGERLKSETESKDGEISTLRGQLQSLTVGRTAVELAADLAVVVNGVSSAKALLPHIERRLKMEVDSTGVATVRVLDNEGKPSALTLDQLKDQFKADPVFAPLIAANKANGGGADGGKGGGGGATTKFADMTEQQRTELYNKNPAEYKRLSDDFKAAQKGGR